MGTTLAQWPEQDKRYLITRLRARAGGELWGWFALSLLPIGLWGAWLGYACGLRFELDLAGLLSCAPWVLGAIAVWMAPGLLLLRSAQRRHYAAIQYNLLARGLLSAVLASDARQRFPQLAHVPLMHRIRYRRSPDPQAPANRVLDFHAMYVVICRQTGLDPGGIDLSWLVDAEESLVIPTVLGIVAWYLRPYNGPDTSMTATAWLLLALALLCEIAGAAVFALAASAKWALWRALADALEALSGR